MGDFIMDDKELKMKEHNEKRNAHLAHFHAKAEALRKERERLHEEYEARHMLAREKKMLHEERKAVFHQKYGGLFSGAKTLVSNLSHGHVTPTGHTKKMKGLHGRVVHASAPHAAPFEGGLFSSNHGERHNTLFGDTSGKNWLTDKPKGSKHLIGK